MFATEIPNESFEFKTLRLAHDVKLFSEQRNVESSVSIAAPRVTFKELILHESPEIVLSEKPTTPEEELERTRLIFEGFKFPSGALTVGDLTEKQDRKTRGKEARQYLRNMKEGLNIGDLSVVTEEKPDNPRLDNMFIGGRVVEPAVSESQEADAERVRKHKERVGENFSLRNLMAGCRDEKLEEYADKFLRNKASESNEPRDKA
jgi:hypothetical protein